MHKRLMDPVIASLDTERGAYFADVSEDLAVDSRIERNANLVFLVLAEAAPFLPMQLPKRDLIGRLITFVERNQHRIACTAFDPQYLTNKDLMKPVISEFIVETTAQVLKMIEDGNIDPDHGTTIIRMSWPIDPDAFPYQDPDDDEDEDEGGLV